MIARHTPFSIVGGREASAASEEHVSQAKVDSVTIPCTKDVKTLSEVVLRNCSGLLVATATSVRTSVRVANSEPVEVDATISHTGVENEETPMLTNLSTKM